MPPLAERPDDILPLARHFLPPGKQLGDDAVRTLLAHRWRGNVRELRNTIQRASLLGRGVLIGAGDLGLATPSEAVATGAAEELDRSAIEAALQRSGGVVSQAAADLGLSRQALYRRMERFGMERPGSSHD